jgi:hypothetical protein
LGEQNINYWKGSMFLVMYVCNFAGFIFISRLPTSKNRLVDEAGSQCGEEQMKKC